MKNISSYAIKFEDEETQQKLAILSHDLRNPVAGIQMSAQLILRNQGNPAILEKLAQGILASAAKMTLMLDSLEVENHPLSTRVRAPYLAPRA